MTRYSDFVPMKPPVAPRTWLQCACAFGVFGIAIVLVTVRRRAASGCASPAALDEEPDRP
jgi:cytochrome c-type biogenesis protein CcmH/NrfF